MLVDAQRSCYVHQHMNTHKRSSNPQACGEQVASEASTPAQPQCQQIKLAMDVHAASIVVVRMLDGAKPQPPQTFKPAEFLVWVKKQVALAKAVITLKKWKSVLLNPKAHARARKRAIIAFARQLLIDLWRWQTGRRTPEQLGWVMTQG